MKVLILNQAFYPDVASTAQHASDLAKALSERGHQVTALASTRCYDNPATRYRQAETWAGVKIRRIWSSGFGKKAKWRRAADFATFLGNCVWHLAWLERQDVVIALTSPPLISYLAALLTGLRGGRLVFWVMDLNPDEAIAAGWLNPQSRGARLLNKMLQYSIERSARIIALDRFMADRLIAKGAAPETVRVLPPWSHNEEVFFNAEGREQFRAKHGLDGKFVVMYSGNHSPCHSLQTLLEAALEMRDNREIMFCFVGGGSEHAKVRDFAQAHGLTNILCLPYQPLQELSGSLSAADLQVVVMGNAFVGMIHPCKIYNILSIGAPVLYIGPKESHIGDLRASFEGSACLFDARHGDVAAVREAILEAKHQGVLALEESIQVSAQFSQEALVAEHVSVVESAAPKRSSAAVNATGRKHAHLASRITEEL